MEYILPMCLWLIDNALEFALDSSELKLGTIRDIDISGNFLVEGTERNSQMITVVAADEAVRYLASLMVEIQKLAVTLI